MSQELPRLSKSAGIAVVAPSGAPLDEAAVLNGLARLQTQGFEVHHYYDPAQRMQRFGGTEQSRVAQMHEAARNPDVSVVMALRGSYGFSRILPLLDWDLLASSGKIFVGYSDFTLMHLGLLARGVQSLAGPMLCDDYTREHISAYTLEQFISALQNDTHQVSFEAAGQPDLQVEGRLWGGNLAMLTHATGTPYSAMIEDGILFLEDVGEHPYRVERMLLQLHYAGMLASQKAILLGAFSGYRLAEHDAGYDFEAMLIYLRSLIKVPLITGLPFGHIRERATLVVGANTVLTVKNQQAQVTMHHQCSLPLKNT